MKAGRELDALVAEKVMGWKIKTFPSLSGLLPGVDVWIKGHNTFVSVENFNPSTNITDAWKVLGKFDGHILTKSKSDGFIYEILLHDGKGYDIIGESIAETAELAICLAALKAVGVEVDD